MTSILEVITAVNKELQHGQLIHEPIVAWAFDMSRAQVEPVPVATGPHARFLNNRSSAAYQLVSANPGFFQLIYLVDRSRQLLEQLTAEQRAEMKKTAGAFDLGIWGPEDSSNWREIALQCEQNLFEDLLPSVIAHSIGDARSC